MLEPEDPVSATSILAGAFIGLTEETLTALKKVAQPRRFPPNSLICRQGDVAETFYVILEGAVAVEQHLPAGEDRVLGLLRPRDYFGELGLLDGQPRMADCRTLVASSLLEITQVDFDRFLEQSPAVGNALLRRMLTNMRTLEKLSTEDLRAKNQALQQAYDELQAAHAELVAKKALERELAIAAGVQRSLLPGALPARGAYRFAGSVTPAKLVGGDLYDVFDIDADHVGLMVADVADKGVHASLIMAVVRTLFLQEGKRSLSPAEVALNVHQGLLDISTTDDTFVTAFYGVLHRETGRLNYVIAGQERPLLYRPGQGVKTLMGKGRFLGMLDELTLAEYHTDLLPGDRLVLFSDGVPDAINLQGEQFGTGRLGILLNQFAHLPADGVLDKINERLQDWSKHVDQFDDITLVVAEMREMEL
ncbi:MAG: SpoIIE family protein phosphatase [Anaerolineales bacterium]|nr:SpoIIE family protein phosphatase [Anaerolineales bacterium]